jgi:hypothetical protein
MRRFSRMQKNISSSVSLIFVLLAAICASAQVMVPSGSGTPSQPVTQPRQAPPMPFALSQSLAQLDQTAQSTIVDLSRVRVDKWKTDDRHKQQARTDLESLQRNLNAALPGLIQQVRANPASLAAAVKLYRNVNALHDVMTTVTESAGAFGPKDDFSALATDMSNLDAVRRSLADQLEQMAANQDAQVARLVSQAQAQQAPSASTTPKRVVVDDNPPPKPATKKKPVPKPPQSSQAPH